VWECVVVVVVVRDKMVEPPVELRRGKPGCTKEHCLDLSSTSYTVNKTRRHQSNCPYTN
jgi:hypothetical protein